MKELAAKYEIRTCTVYSGKEIVGEIIYDDNKHIAATMFVNGRSFKIEPVSDSDKNIIIREESNTILKFDFDYLWGGATLLSDNEETGYEIKGKFLKPGTRLVDEDNNDLVVVTTLETLPPSAQFKIIVHSDEINDFLIVSTLYYHNYASAGKLLSVLFANSVGGAL